MSAVPLLLLGGAAVLLLGGKKKKKPSTSAEHSAPLPYSVPVLPTTTKKKGSGYSNVSREKMQWIQTTLAALGYDVGPSGMDGLYGKDTKAAVSEFQADYGLGVDGKPGKNTQAKLADALAGRAQAQDQGQAPQDECDPLNPGSWGSGNVCVLEGGRWVRRTGSSSSSGGSSDDVTTVPKLKSGDEVVFNTNLTGFEVGATWRYATLDKWLNSKRVSGMLATKSNEADSYDASLGLTALEIYAKAYLGIMPVATAWAGVYMGMTAVAAVASAPVTVAASVTLGVAYAALNYIMGTESVSSFRRKEIEVTGALAFEDFINTQVVLVGPDRVPIKIKNLKRTDGVVEFLKFVSDYIARFQGSTY